MMKEYMDKIDRYATVSNKLKWYTNARPFIPAYMSRTETEAAYFYCPYVPVMRTTNV